MAEAMITWYVGVDWGSEKHQACILDAQGTIVGEREFSHSAAGLAELGGWIFCDCSCRKRCRRSDRGTARTCCR